MIKIYPTSFAGTIKAPASKAHAHRLLIMSAMSTYPVCVKNVPECEDINTTLSCLMDLGCKIAKKGTSEYYIDPFPKNIPLMSCNLNFEHSETTSRLLLPLLASQGIKVNAVAKPELMRKSMHPITSRMAIRGVKFTGFSMPMEMSGRLEGGDYAMNVEDGPDFISGLLMALPLLLDPSELRISGYTTDAASIDLTFDSLKLFGIEAEEASDGFFIPPKQLYQSPGTVVTENDWSIAALWRTAGATCRPAADGRYKTVMVTDLNLNSKQLFKDTDDILALLHQDFKYVNIDASMCPDLATVFAAVALAKGSSIDITGVPQLKNRECNRLQAMADIAITMGQKAHVTDDGIKILGNGKPSYEENTVIDCHGDPWIFMSMAVAAGQLEVPVVLDDETLPGIIYGNFFNDYKTLGGKFEIFKG